MRAPIDLLVLAGILSVLSAAGVLLRGMASGLLCLVGAHRWQTHETRLEPTHVCCSRCLKLRTTP